MSKKQRFIITGFLLSVGLAPTLGDVAFMEHDGPFFVSGYTEIWSGYFFRPVTDIEMTAVGFYDHEGDGFALPHEVHLLNAATLELLLTETVESADPLIDQYRYQSIDPFTLVTGVQYLLLASSNESDFIPSYHAYWGPGATFTPLVTEVFGSQETWYPYEIDLKLSPYHYLSVNAMLRPADAQVVPAPAGILLGMLGLAFVGGRARYCG
jgi:hypothetical protein